MEKDDYTRDAEGRFAHKPGSAARPAAGQMRFLYGGREPTSEGRIDTTGLEHISSDGNSEDGDSKDVYRTPDGGTLTVVSSQSPDHDFGYSLTERAEYRTPDGRDIIVVDDTRVEGEGWPDISHVTVDGMRRTLEDARRRLTLRTGVEPRTVFMGSDPGLEKAYVNGQWEPTPEPAGFHPIRRRRIRRENRRLLNENIRRLEYDNPVDMLNGNDGRKEKDHGPVR